MSVSKLFRLVMPAAVVGSLLAASLACGSSTTEQLAQAAATPTAAEAQPAGENTAAPAATVEAGPTAAAAPTAVPPSPTPEPEALRVSAQGFGQDGRQAGYAFMVENPNPGLAVENSQYQVAFYNADGTVLETDSGYLELILPGQKLGVGGVVFLEEGATAAKVEVQLSDGDPAATDQIPGFTVETVRYYPGQFGAKATGVVTSPYSRALTSLRVSAVAYNAAGEIIGGGFTFTNFILANGRTGVAVALTSLPDVATVELYPVLSGLSLLTGAADQPADAADLKLNQSGFGQEETQLGYGLIIENPNAAYAIEGSQYHLTAYAADGAVLGVEEGYVEVLLPGQILGVGGKALVEAGPVASVEVQVYPGRFEKSEALPAFTAENIAFQGGQFLDTITGQVVSPYAKDVSNVRASGIAYNAAGEIIGGGFTFIDFVPANGKAAVEISVTVAGEPAAVEIYASPSGLSEFK